jgi:hypothetical protein
MEQYQAGWLAGSVCMLHLGFQTLESLKRDTNVLDLVNQFRDVVLVMCIFSSGKPQGVRILERGVHGEGDGNGEISLRATWDRGGQDPITARRVPSK